MKKTFFFIGGILMSLLQTFSQGTSGIRPLSLGDTVPDLVFNNLINYKNTSAKLSDFRDKLIILDFWNTHCGPCVAALPSMNRLQQKFNNRLQIIPVTIDEKEIVRKFLDRRWPDSLHMQLPFVVSDTILTAMLQYGAVPHEVWINAQGIIEAITDHVPVTEENIRIVLAGKKLQVPMKTRFAFHPLGQPLLIHESDAGVNTLLYQSLITGYRQEVKGSGQGMMNNKTLYRQFAYQMNIRQLFMIAFGKKEAFAGQENRVILENVSDSARYLTRLKESDPAYGIWRQHNLYNYEGILPVRHPDESKQSLLSRAQQLMVSGLTNYFGDRYGLQAAVQHRNVRCWVIRMGTDHKKLTTQFLRKEMYLQGTSTRVWNRFTLTSIINDIGWLGSAASAGLCPVTIDSTGFTGLVDMTLDQEKLGTLQGLQGELGKYGLRVTEEMQPIEVIVLREN